MNAQTKVVKKKIKRHIRIPSRQLLSGLEGWLLAAQLQIVIVTIRTRRSHLVGPWPCYCIDLVRRIDFLRSLPSSAAF